MNLVQEYFELVKEVVSWRKTVHDGVTANIHNQKVRRMQAIAEEIEQAFPTLKEDFFDLLSAENEYIRLWVAHHMLEDMTYEPIFRKCALKVIRHYARTEIAEPGYGEKDWLKAWYETHPDDQWL